MADSEWGFSFDAGFDGGEPANSSENTRAAGALYCLYLLGDQLHLFALTDAVILKWWKGELDVPKGDLAYRMYRYYQSAKERHSAEERTMLYKMVFGIADGQQISGVPINEDFSNLWNNLLSEVVKYIEKQTERIGNEQVISTQAVYQAIGEIQNNLGSRMTGIALISTREIYANLQECMSILGHSEINKQVARGRTSNVREVIKTLLAEQCREIPDVTVYFRMAGTIYKIFEFIALFKGVPVSSQEFAEFVSFVEDYIVNMTQFPSPPV